MCALLAAPLPMPNKLRTTTASVKRARRKPANHAAGLKPPRHHHIHLTPTASPPCRRPKNTLKHITAIAAKLFCVCCDATRPAHTRWLASATTGGMHFYFIYF
jgi:hypothetical protein